MKGRGTQGKSEGRGGHGMQVTGIGGQQLGFDSNLHGGVGHV